MSDKVVGWKKVKIGDLCEVGRGSSPRPIADSKYFKDGTIPWIKIADATKSGKYLYVTKEKVNEYGASFSRLLPKGTLIVAASGTLGYTQFLGVQGCIHDGWLYLHSFRGIDKHFLYYLFQWRQQHFYNMAYGAAIQNINTTILREMEIDFPPLPTQRKIAAILSAYDDLIENNTRRIKILEEMAQALYREWFVKFRFPGHEKVKMVESELGMMPEGWELVKLRDISDINISSIKKENGLDKINYIDISSVSTGQVDKVEQITFSEAPSRARRIVKHEDIIWSTVRPNRKSYSVILNPIENLIVSTRFAVISPKKAPYTYLYFTLTTDDFIGYLTNCATGAAYPAVNSEDFKKALLLLPPKKLLESFHGIVIDFFDNRQNMHLKNINLSRTRDMLLPKLISGDVDVSNLKIEIRKQET